MEDGENAGHQFVATNRLGARRLAMEAQSLVYDRRHTAKFQFSAFQISLYLGNLGLLARQVGQVGDCLQRIVDLMRDRARQTAHSC